MVIRQTHQLLIPVHHHSKVESALNAINRELTRRTPNHLLYIHHIQTHNLTRNSLINSNLTNSSHIRLRIKDQCMHRREMLYTETSIPIQFMFTKKTRERKTTRMNVFCLLYAQPVCVAVWWTIKYIVTRKLETNLLFYYFYREWTLPTERKFKIVYANLNDDAFFRNIIIYIIVSTNIGRMRR